MYSKSRKNRDKFSKSHAPIIFTAKRRDITRNTRFPLLWNFLFEMSRNVWLSKFYCNFHSVETWIAFTSLKFSTFIFKQFSTNSKCHKFVITKSHIIFTQRYNPKHSVTIRHTKIFYVKSHERCDPLRILP